MEMLQGDTLSRALTAQNAGRPEEAARLYRLILQTQPDHIEAKIRLVGLLQASGQNISGPAPSQETLNELLELYRKSSFKKAEKLARRLSKKFPQHQIAWKVLGAILLQIGNAAEAVQVNKRAIELAPSDFEALNNLAIAYAATGGLEEAEACYRGVTRINFSFAPAHNNLGITLKTLGRLREAEESYRRAIAQQPSFAEAHNNLGNTLVALGELEEARTCLQQAIILKPDFVEAHRYLTAIKEFYKKDHQYLEMKALHRSSKTSPDERCHLSFALAKANEDLGFFSEAFEYYREGNALRKHILNYDIAQDVELFKKLTAAHENIVGCTLNSSNVVSSLLPVFIVGLPRSGTTLVEQIVSSHSEVTGAGELGHVAEFGKSLASGAIEISADLVQEFRDKYLAELEKIGGGNHMVVDKAPLNFLYMSLLKIAFPEARVIHVRRNSAAVCWANFKHYFPSEGLGYSYAVEDMVQYYGLYCNLMKYWTEQFPDFIYELDYELLTVNQEEETRKMIEYLGLTWQEACLRPEENDRAVTTASNIQIREKVYRDSSLKWKSYEPYLRGAFGNL